MKLSENTEKVVAAIIFFLVLVVFSPVIIPVTIVNAIAALIHRRRYGRFLVAFEGKRFFCYNNRKTTQAFVESEILPRLSRDVEIIYVEGRTPKSAFDPRMISAVLYNVKDKTGFPYLIKIRNGKLADLSINNAVHNAKVQHKPIAPLITDIHAFFDNDPDPGIAIG